MTALFAAYHEFVTKCDVQPNELLITRAAFVAGVVAGMSGAVGGPAQIRRTLRALDEELYTLEADLLTLRAARGLK